MKKNFRKKIFTKNNFIKGKSKYLVIVESPSKCEKIEGYLGLDYKCIASKGHLRQLDSYKKYDIKYKNIGEKEGHISFLQTIISQYPKGNIILATDDDREGESIAWHICELFNLPIETTKRITFNEITKSAILASIENIKTINMKLVNAQKARQVLDVIVGYKISPLLWKYAYNNKDNGLSAGRCQTPALRLIYDNYLKKKDCENDVKHKITGFFFSKNIEFTLSKELISHEEVEKFLKNSINFNYELKTGSPRESIKSSPEPFNTSKLLQIASQNLHISPKETMQLCQILYQDGLISYMRTDSKKYSKDFLDKSKNYIKNKYSDKYVGDLKKIEKTDTKDPHEGIRVSNIEVTHIKRDNRIDGLYKLIWNNTIESCMSNALYEIIDCEITAPDNLKYKTFIESPIFLGWKEIKNKENQTEIQNNNNGLLLFLKTIEEQKTKFSYNKIQSIETIHLKHSHYNECGLIKKLEDLEIGRPSTFSTFIDTIQQRGYVKKQNIEGTKMKTTDYTLIENKIKKSKNDKVIGNENNKLVIQPVGIIVIEFLIKNFEELFSYNYTKDMENELDNILIGILDDWTSICKECESKIKELSKPLKKLTKETYTIDENNEFTFSKYGATIREKKEDGSYNYKKVKSDIKIDLDKLKEGKYDLDELVEIKERYIGKYEDEDLFVKHGMYGLYAQWGENKKTLNSIKKTIENITMEDIEKCILTKNESSNILRVINDDISVRKGKYGPYVYYKRKDMGEPKFYNIKKFKEGFTYCEKKVLINWLVETYSLPIEV